MMEGRRFSGEPKQAQFPWGVRQNLRTLKIQYFSTDWLWSLGTLGWWGGTSFRRFDKIGHRTLSGQGFQRPELATHLISATRLKQLIY